METIKETLNLLYALEEYFEYDETEIGNKVGTLINKLQKELNNKDMSKCIECNGELICLGNHTYEDYGLEGEGVVSNYSCIDESCPVEMVLVYSKA